MALRAGAESHPLLDRRPPERITLVLLTSDRGLAGGFNANVFRVVQRFIAERKRGRRRRRARSSLEIVGKKGRDYFRRRKADDRARVRRRRPARPRSQIAREMAQIVIARVFQTAQADAVYLVYNEFKSAVQQRVVVEPLLPVIARRPGGRRPQAAPPAGRSTSSTSRRRRSCSTRCCRSTSSRRSTARCSSRSPPSSARA